MTSHKCLQKKTSGTISSSKRVNESSPRRAGTVLLYSDPTCASWRCCPERTHSCFKRLPRFPASPSPLGAISVC